MTTSTSPADDIIELTEIVEEGIPLDTKFEDFAMDKAVDAKSLDQELDDLLGEGDPLPAAPQNTGDEIDLDILFDEPAPAPAQPQKAEPKTPPAEAGMDMSDIDDLFDSLGIGEKEEGDTALDIILDGDLPGQAKKNGDETFYPADSIDLDLDIPGTATTEDGSSIHELTDELLADIPETVLLQSPAAEPAAPTPFAPKEPGEDAAILELTEEHVEEPALAAQDAPAPPAADLEDAAKEPTPKAAQADKTVAASNAGLGIVISSRLDAPKSRPQAAPEPSPDEVLALTPSAPEDLPATQNLRREILEQVEARLAQLAAGSRLDGLQDSVNALQQKIAAMPDIRAELAMASPLSTVQKLEMDLDELRALIPPRQELQPEQILALLPQSPQAWPVAQALRQELADLVESRIAELASSSSIDGLQESVNALQSQVEAIPDIRSELAKASSSADMQKIQARLDELATRVQGQDETVALLRQTLADKDAAIEALNAEAKTLREKLAAQAEGAPAASEALKGELRQYVLEQVPLAAAKIVREEIKALLKELGG